MIPLALIWLLFAAAGLLGLTVCSRHEPVSRVLPAVWAFACLAPLAIVVALACAL